MITETIFALSTAPGRAGVAIFRISGPEARMALSTLSRVDLLAARRVGRVRLCDPDSGDALDDGLAIWFPGPASFTGEDVAELHVHGGRATVEAVAGALARLDGLRMAEPGEFTRRAFEHGKLDLTAAEGLADLVDAETEAQRRQALDQLGGALASVYKDWRQRLLGALAHLEAAIDFADEDLPDSVAWEADHKIRKLAGEISRHLDDKRRGERMRDGLHIAILGAPNVGKSSLLNALARREAAIVSSTAGTTRDVIEVRLDLGGWPVILADTAGVRGAREVAGDGVEAEGVRRALERAAEADLKLVLFDASKGVELDPRTAALVDEDAIAVVNKIDLARVTKAFEVAGRGLMPLSVVTGEGLSDLLVAIERAAAERLSSSAGPALSRARHRVALEECVAALGRAVETDSADLRAEDVRLAVRALGRITGRVDVEDVLDVIFRDFCIGK